MQVDDGSRVTPTVVRSMPYPIRTWDAFEAEVSLCAWGLHPGGLDACPGKNHLVNRGVELGPRTPQGRDVAKEGGDAALQFGKTVEAEGERKQKEPNCHIRQDIIFKQQPTEKLQKLGE